MKATHAQNALAPEYVRGVTNLRERVTPVVGLRRKFGMQPTEDHSRNPFDPRRTSCTPSPSAGSA